MCNEITLKFHGHKYFAMQNSTIDKIQDDIQLHDIRRDG